MNVYEYDICKIGDGGPAAMCERGWHCQLGNQNRATHEVRLCLEASVPELYTWQITHGSFQRPARTSRNRKSSSKRRHACKLTMFPCLFAAFPHVLIMCCSQVDYIEFSNMVMTVDPRRLESRKLGMNLLSQRVRLCGVRVV